VRPLYDGLRAARWRAPRIECLQTYIGSPRSRLTVRGFALPFQISRLPSRRGTVELPQRLSAVGQCNCGAGDGPAYGASEAPARREPLGGSGRFTESARRRIRLDPIIYRDARHVPSDRRFYLRSFFDPDLLKK
jgi:hypothetical protein